MARKAPAKLTAEQAEQLRLEIAAKDVMIKRLAREKERRGALNKLNAYVPYAKQREFHEAGALYRERAMMAGNQLGKTTAGAAEACMHLTGRYPSLPP